MSADLIKGREGDTLAQITDSMFNTLLDDKRLSALQISRKYKYQYDLIQQSEDLLTQENGKNL